MLIPNKFTNPNFSLIKVSALILKRLMKNKIDKFSDMLNFLSWELNIDSTEVLIQGMNFLYLVGKIEYKMDNDTIILLHKS